MKYCETIVLKDGRTSTIRSCRFEDGEAVLANFLLTHAETDWLLSYPDEKEITVGQEAAFLKQTEESDCDVQLLAEVDGKVVGLAGIRRVGAKEKVRRRASFGISTAKDFWGLGIGRALTRACLECARKAGYAQLELEVVEGNERAIRLYESEGFVEYGRNPRGFHSRENGWQALILMRLELI